MIGSLLTNARLDSRRQHRALAPTAKDGRAGDPQDDGDNLGDQERPHEAGRVGTVRKGKLQHPGRSEQRGMEGGPWAIRPLRPLSIKDHAADVQGSVRSFVM